MRDGSAKRYVVAGALLVFVWGGAQALVEFLGAPITVDLEAGSSKIGWRPATEFDDIARDIFARVNDERTARRLPALAWDDGLADRSRRWSETMIAERYEHSAEEFRAHPAFAGTGENIFMGPLDAAEAHVGWMLSDGHRANVLHPSFTAMGVGVVCRNDGRMWATQIFGVPHDSPMVETTDPPAEPITRRDDGPACPVRARYGPIEGGL